MPFSWNTFLWESILSSVRQGMATKTSRPIRLKMPHQGYGYSNNNKHTHNTQTNMSGYDPFLSSAQWRMVRDSMKMVEEL